MKIRKLIAAVTSMAMLGTLAGCGSTSVEAPADVSQTSAGGNETSKIVIEGDPAVADVPDTAPEGVPTLKELYGDDTINITVFSQLANYSGELTGWFAEVMKREFNAKLTIIPDTDGMFDTRMESGNLGDIVVFGSNGDQYTRAVSEGMLYDWNDDDLLTNYGPYIKAHMPYALENNANLNESVTGKHVVHGFGHNVGGSDRNAHEEFMYTMDVRWDLYKELGYPEVKNLDDFYDLMVSMKQICPTDENGNPTYATSLWPDWDGDMVMYVKSFATCYWGYEGDQGLGHYDVETGNFYYALDEGSPYLKSLKFFNKLFQAGLIDPDSMTQTYDKMTEKVKAGGTFFSIFNYAGSAVYNSEQHLSEGKAMYPLVAGDATPLAYGMNILGGNRIWTIGANTEYPELCMAIINYLCTPEGYLTYWYGPKDLCWYYDENGYTCLTEFGETAYKDRKGTMMPDEWGGASFNDGTFQANNTTWSRDALNPDSNGETFNCDNWVSRQGNLNSEIFADWKKFTNSISPQDYVAKSNFKTAIGTSYAMGKKSSELKTIWTQVTKQVTTSSWQAIYAKSDDEFDKIVAEMIQKCNEYDPSGECRKFSENEAAIRHGLEEEARKDS